jgi:hypothetical protein
LYPVKGQPGIPKIIIYTLEHDPDQHDPDEDELWTTPKYREISAYLTNVTRIKSSKIKKLDSLENTEFCGPIALGWARIALDKCIAQGLPCSCKMKKSYCSLLQPRWTSSGLRWKIQGELRFSMT